MKACCFDWWSFSIILLSSVIFKIFSVDNNSDISFLESQMDSALDDYFCNYCGSLLCLSTSQMLPPAAQSAHYNSYQASKVLLVCYHCSSSHSDGTNSSSFIPLRQILKAEIIKDSDMWANASCTEEKCPKCGHNQAYYLQVQTRSADEPMTTYYRCVKCAHNWKDWRHCPMAVQNLSFIFLVFHCRKIYSKCLRSNYHKRL